MIPLSNEQRSELRQRRMARELTLEVLAALLGVSRMKLLRLEQGHTRRVHRVFLDRWRKALRRVTY